jgi:hypothetical protein
MLKEVGASGHISLGEQYAGRLFEVIVHPGDRIELIPVQTGGITSSRTPAAVRAPDGWVPLGGYDECTQWALDNREALEQYAREIEENGTAAEQLERFLKPLGHDDEDHGRI